MRKSSNVLVGVLAMLIVASCGAPAVTPAATQSAAAKIAGGSVTIRLPGDWGNPIDGGHTVTSAYGIMLSAAMYDTLVYQDMDTGAIKPYLATSWQITPTSITFKLRDDATCSDGTKVTPTVVYDSFAHFISPKTASRWLGTTFGSGPFTLAKDDAASTFTFTSGKPFALLLPGFGDARTSIICPAGLQPTADFTKTSYGSGPFVFKSAIQNSEYVVTKRDGWNWGPNGWKSSDSGFPDQITWKVIASDSTAANALLTGQIDVSGISGPDVKRLAADGTVDHKIKEGGAPYALFMNEAADRPTSSEPFRKAIVTALDPRAWTVAAGEPDAPVSTNIHVNPGGYCYTDLSSIIPKPSVANAKQLLLANGYTAGADGKLLKNGQPAHIAVLGTSFTGSGVEYIADTLQQVGFTVDLQNTDYNTFAQQFVKLNWDVVVGLFGGFTKTVPTSTPLFMTGKSPTDGGNNRVNRTDPALATLIDKAYGASTEADACAAWKDFETYSIDHAIVMPWATAVTHWFAPKGAFSYVPVSSFLNPQTLRRLK